MVRVEYVKEKEIQFMQRPCKVTRTDEDVPQPRQTTEPKGSGSERRGQLGTGWSRGDEPPIDWCLKQKVRFMSPKSFSWCCTLKSLEEAQGLNDFITKLKEPKVDITECGQSSGKEFQRSIMYWIHPSLPWVKLFPRMTGDNNRVSRAALMTTDDDVLAALRTDWAESFTSAFYLVRARYCPYIYLCAHQFTAMFLTTGTQQETLRGVVTPTTRGFREALANEGIEFTLPLLEKQRVDSEGNSVENGVEKKESGTGDEDLDNEDDTAASVWLESIGLNKANFPSLDPNKVKIQRECFRAIDNRPQSLVHVEGSNVQALFNFLLNWRSCVASSGPQTGLPPTILSPVGFRGATLKSLKVKQSSVKQQDEAGVVTSYGVLEVSGPILPQNLQAISQLFKSTQDGEYTATFHNHEATVPFNAAFHSSTQGNDNASPPHQSITTELNTDTQGTPQTGTVKELEFSQSKFFWKCY
ncbi:protein downstream neighbor of son homolog [Liolophura sinensis]|uniref:protein downstream neighbor of son homolog n=1 Tax=Liolophura sinensis TaxID=3198878 RepID=UPI003158580C